eukprot:scaffold241_cov242-Pinguiococcus_pyrenoidosus.AAC.10
MSDGSAPFATAKSIPSCSFCASSASLFAMASPSYAANRWKLGILPSTEMIRVVVLSSSPKSTSRMPLGTAAGVAGCGIEKVTSASAGSRLPASETVSGSHSGARAEHPDGAHLGPRSSCRRCS